MQYLNSFQNESDETELKRFRNFKMNIKNANEDEDESLILFGIVSQLAEHHFDFNNK